MARSESPSIPKGSANCFFRLLRELEQIYLLTLPSAKTVGCLSSLLLFRWSPALKSLGHSAFGLRTCCKLLCLAAPTTNRFELQTLKGFILTGSKTSLPSEFGLKGHFNHKTSQKMNSCEGNNAPASNLWPEAFEKMFKRQESDSKDALNSYACFGTNTLPLLKG